MQLSCFVLIIALSHTEARRVRVRTRPVEDSEQLIQESENSEEERRPIVQYFRADPRQDTEQRIVLVPASGSEEDYSDIYRPSTTARARADHVRPQQQIAYKSTTVAPRRKQDDVTKQPPVQTIRNYNKVNDDGSFTFGYEAADGSFKEETRGTDCVVRGKYGYIDPDGNKREFTYVSGNPCDPNNPEGSEEENVASEEESDENIPQNYPQRRPVARPAPQRPAVQHHTTQRPTTTVFQNVYAHQSLGTPSEEEEEENIPQTIQIGQRPLRPSPRPAQAPTQRHRVQIVNTTPAPTTAYNHQATHPVSITPRPNYRPAQTNPPATTYKPHLQFVNTQKQTVQNVPVTTPASFATSTRGSSYSSTHGGQIDFDAEFKKFQKDNAIHHQSSTPSIVSTPKQFKASPSASTKSANPATNAPIYQSQLIFDPATGQYDSNLYQQIPQTDGDFQLNHRHQPYHHQQHPSHVTAAPHLVNLQQLQDQSPLYRHQIQHSSQQQVAQAAQQQQIPQQLYQKQQSELQFLNSQQLFAQQLQLQQSQLQRDRQQAATRAPQHRFQVPAGAGQQYYYVQQPNGNGQIDAFLRGHNIDFN